MDRAAFEALYDRHESCIFNFCLRVVGSREAAATATKAAFLGSWREFQASEGSEGELRLHLLTSARDESARLIESLGGDDAVVSSPLRLGEANGRLPVQYRELLALREFVGSSYAEISRVVGVDRTAVAELLWRARLELRDELTASRLMSIAPVANRCRRALALIVMGLDGELPDADERRWLRRHLRSCGKCRVSQDAAREASASYRAWPAAATPMGMRESVLSAAGSTFATAPAG